MKDTHQNVQPVSNNRPDSLKVPAVFGVASLLILGLSAGVMLLSVPKGVETETIPGSVDALAGMIRFGENAFPLPEVAEPEPETEPAPTPVPAPLPEPFVSPIDHGFGYQVANAALKDLGCGYQLGVTNEEKGIYDCSRFIYHVLEDMGIHGGYDYCDAWRTIITHHWLQMDYNGKPFKMKYCETLDEYLTAVEDPECSKKMILYENKDDKTNIDMRDHAIAGKIPTGTLAVCTEYNSSENHIQIVLGDYPSGTHMSPAAFWHYNETVLSDLIREFPDTITPENCHATFFSLYGLDHRYPTLFSCQKLDVYDNVYAGKELFLERQPYWVFINCASYATSDYIWTDIWTIDDGSSATGVRIANRLQPRSEEKKTYLITFPADAEWYK